MIEQKMALKNQFLKLIFDEKGSTADVKGVKITLKKVSRLSIGYVQHFREPVT